MKYILAFLLIPTLAIAQQNYWNLPKDLNDTNTVVNFELDTTWHLVHGKTANISGKVFLQDKKDYKSINAEISIPVANFDTDSKSRDKEMRGVMQADKFSNVIVRLNGSNDICDPKTLETQSECNANLDALIKIRDVEKSIVLPVKISKQNNQYLISGEVTLNWPEFGVEDPSILIARVAKSMKIKFSCTI